MLQREALEILKTGSNIFLTGVPGAGKTYVVNEYIQYLEDKGIYPAITASTGIAATHIGGVTIHSFSGIGIESNIDDYKLEKILEREKLVKKIQNTKVLIIDEISMLDAQTLDNVNKVLKAIKNPELPFGGVQIIFVGDFFQLPPVARKGEMKNYCFASSSWKEARPLTCYLEEQYRQSDEVFTKLLLAIRANEIEEDHIEILDSLVKKTNKKFGIKNSFKEQTGKGEEWEEETVEIEESPKSKEEVEKEGVYINILELHSHNKDVDQINEENLKNLEGKEFVYKMLTTGKSTLVESLIKTCLSPETLRLKVGAKVIFTKNSLDGEYANGTLAEVVELESWYIKVKTKSGRMIDVKQADWSMEDDGKVKAKLSQYPLRLAWAITVHKSQGMSLDEAIINLGVAFEYGQGYVALSRIRNLKGVYLKSYNAKSLRVNESISEFDQKIQKDSRFIQNKFLKADRDKLIETQNRFIIKAGGRLEGGIVRKEQAKKATAQITLDMLAEGKSIVDVAKERDLSVKTLTGHIEEMYKKKKISKLEVSKIAGVNIFNIPNEVKKSFKKHKLKRDEEGNIKLTPVFKDLKEKYSYDDLRWYRMFL